MGKRKMKDTLPPGQLYPLAIKLAKATSLENLYEKTGLPISWLRKFRAGKIESPGVQRVELVIVKLTGNQIVFEDV